MVELPETAEVASELRRALKATPTGDGECRPTRLCIWLRDGAVVRWAVYISPALAPDADLVGYTKVTAESLFGVARRLLAQCELQLEARNHRRENEH